MDDKQAKLWYETELRHLVWFCLRLTVAAIPSAILAFITYVIFVFLVSLLARTVL